MNQTHILCIFKYTQGYERLYPNMGLKVVKYISNIFWEGWGNGCKSGFEIYVLGLFIKDELPIRGTTFFCPFKIALNSLPS